MNMDIMAGHRERGRADWQGVLRAMAPPDAPLEDGDMLQSATSRPLDVR